MFFSTCKVPFLGQVPVSLLWFFFFFDLLVQEFDPDESTCSNVLFDNISRDWLEPAPNMLLGCLHNLVLRVEAVLPVDVFENLFKKTNLLQKVVRWESQTPTWECTDPRRVGFARIWNVPCFAAKLWILLAELVGQKTSDVLEALSRTVKTRGRIRRFSFAAGFSSIRKIWPVDVIFWNVWFFLLGTLGDRF